MCLALHYRPPHPAGQTGLGGPGFLIYDTKRSPGALPPTLDGSWLGGRFWEMFSTQSLGSPLSAAAHLAGKHASNTQDKTAASRLFTDTSVVKPSPLLVKISTRYCYSSQMI